MNNMKTLEEIIKSKPVFLEYITNPKSVFDAFGEDYIDGINILFAIYDVDGYDGYAYVLFEQNGILYEVHGGHCSCYGLEGQWSPEEVNLKELHNRLVNGGFGVGMHALKEFLNIK